MARWPPDSRYPFTQFADCRVEMSLSEAGGGLVAPCKELPETQGAKARVASLSYREHENRRCKFSDTAELRAVLAVETDFSCPEKYKMGLLMLLSCS